ncbi:hypothetical protein J7D30_19225 [Escherichia coli]|uniref:hypothetical protein n=1 Tax=Escherichia coli TaxID=562 RepID=UPI001ADFCD73|nr:hypothetical protein [Escherichia coli]MBP0504654.1 hypothetical protein [Escherichia coli]MBP0559955.1 hypothetical protein [Escherichia coli]
MISTSFLSHSQSCASRTTLLSGFHASDRSGSPKPRQRVRQQLPVGVGPDDRMPPDSREPKWAQ